MAKMTSELNEPAASAAVSCAGSSASAIALPEKSSSTFHDTVTNDPEHKGVFCQKLVQWIFYTLYYITLKSDGLKNGNLISTTLFHFEILVFSYISLTFEKRWIC